MNFKNMLQKVLPVGHFYHVPTVSDIKQRESLAVSSIVKRNAEGNVLLGIPKFITEKDKTNILRNLNFD